jgi:phage FluMu protein Com
MKCLACNKELAKKEVFYTEDRNPFCGNPFTCSEEHPNSVKNIVARSGAVQLFTEDELETNLFQNLDVSDEMKDRIMKIATKPQSIRLSKVDIAYYLIQLQENMNFSSLSECIRYCVTLAMENEPIGTPMKEDADDTQTQEESGIKIVVGGSEKKVEKPKEDEEFTF